MGLRAARLSPGFRSAQSELRLLNALNVRAPKATRTGMKAFGPRARKGKLPLRTAKALFVIAISLDIFTLIGVQIAPEAVGHLACAARPFSLIAWPLFRQEWFDYVNSQCLSSVPFEPTISMINFMIKTSLAIGGSVIAFYQIFHAYLTRLDDSAVASQENPSGEAAFLKDLKLMLPAGGIFVLIAVADWLFHNSITPDQFPTSLISKASEDCAILLGIIAALMVVSIAISLIRLLSLYFVDIEK
jgi:hypothetical protein